jgi:phosphate transport system permease protein
MINFFGVPRSSAIAGGLTLGLMTLPIVIISTRAALRAVPHSIREGALAMGATRWQTVRDHVLPMSLPGILTGTIIGLAQAMGETAPLLLIGMVAYIPDVPGSVTDAATVMPAQIYSWASMPQQAFVERTAAAILVLLTVLIALNATAVYLRRRFERRW